MTILRKSLTIKTSKEFEIIDITKLVSEFIESSSVEEGLINIFSKHSTTAISINENELGLLDDFEMFIKNLVSYDLNYKHDLIDNNAKSHIASFLLGSQISIPIKNNKLDLGTWQSLFLIELDGPRSSREIVLTILN